MLMTVAEYEMFNAETGIGADAIQMLLDAAEQAIDARHGPLGSPVVETHDGGQSYLFLRRRAESLTTIVEMSGSTDTALADDDWRIRGDGVSILRLATGTNPRGWWGAPVVVTYVPTDDEADRKRIQLELMNSFIGYEPGITQEQVGSWLQMRALNSAWNPFIEREAILDSLAGSTPAPGFA